MKIKGICPWFGSKRTMAPVIVEQLGPHSHYWEPFCGSCAVLFAKDRSTSEAVNDLHKDLINLALVLQDEQMALGLYARINRCLFHEDLLPIAKTFLVERTLEPGQPDAERAYWYLIFSWMGLNGISGTPLYHTGTFVPRYSTTGQNGATRWASVCESIPAWHQRLLGVQILSRDCFDILPRIVDEADTALYIDPPYLVKGARYVHDFARSDHLRLAEALRRFRKARVVVSYYDHPDLAVLYPGWLKLCAGVAKNMVNSAKRTRKKVEAPEVLLINGKIFGDAPLFEGIED